jgi:late competence protein required for DNA uptake (superfamily II DNA/RNA helicase)
MQLDTIVGKIVQAYYRSESCSKGTMTMSRRKLPCTRCGRHLSSTWRPGPCGTSSLCNACGVMYMVRGGRPRMIELVLVEGRCVWTGRRQDTYQWEEYKEADLKDKRVELWIQQEKERQGYVESKKRKFISL